jgi:hypothetical protein
MTELLAPNGKPSNLTPEQYKLVRTPAFKKWFGDWENLILTKLNDSGIDEVSLKRLEDGVSKVLDENGEPLVVYHSTGNKFNVFDIISNKSSGIEIGSHFGSKSQAIFLANRDNKNSFLIESFLRIMNPLIVEDKGKWTKSIYKNILIKLGYNSNENWENTNAIIQSFLKIGIDGFEYENKYEGKGKSYIVIEPNQIKLADGSNTTFDGNNPDIRFDGGGSVIINPTEINCHNCNWHWKVKDGGDDLFICHKCNYDNTKFYKFEGLEGEKIFDTISYAKGGQLLNLNQIRKGQYEAKSDEIDISLTNPKIQNGFGTNKWQLVVMYRNDDVINEWFDTKNEALKTGVYLLNDFLENNFKKGGRTISQTPAPKKDQIKGSDKNKEGSAKDLTSAKKIKFADDVLEKIQNSVDKHNKKHPNKKITLDSAKAVVRRGMGAYSSTHRPTISGGNENSRVAWGLARLNAFLYKIVNGKSKSGKYSQDNDLIEELGYKVQKYQIGGKLENEEFENSALFFGGFFTGIQRQGIGKSIIYDIFENNPKLENILLYTQQDAIGFWQKLGGEIIKQGNDKIGIHRYFIKINRNSISKSKKIKELGVSYKNIDTKSSKIDKGEYAINYGRQKIGFFFVDDLGTIKTDPKNIILYSANKEKYADGGDIQAYEKAMGISEFKEGGEAKPKKVYVSIKLDNTSKKIPNTFMEYFSFYSEKPFEELKNGKLEGLVGVSTSPNNIAEWFIHRDCLIVMDYEEFIAINETETINYYDPYQLMKNNLFLFKRLYANVSRYGEQEGSYVFTQTLVKILEKIIREINLEMNLAEGQKYSELYRISRFLSPYETRAFPDWIEKNQIKIESPIDLTNAILDFNKLNDNASYIGNGFENPVITFDELLPVVEKGVTNASSVYDSEQEIVLNNRELNIPKNSQLFFIGKDEVGNTRKSDRDELIEKYNLKELYKVHFVDRQQIQKYRDFWLKKEEAKFNKKLEQGREELELKKDQVLDELINYFLENSISYVKNVLEKEILDYYESLDFYDETDVDYVEQSLFSIPLVNSIINTYEFIIKNFWKEFIQKKRVENLDLYAFMRFYSDVESEIKKYFENNYDELQKLDNYRNIRGSGSLDAYRFERLLLKTINDYEKLPELIDYKELSKMYLDKMGAEIYRYYDKKDLQLISKYKDGGEADELNLTKNKKMENEILIVEMNMYFNDTSVNFKNKEIPLKLNPPKNQNDFIDWAEENNIEFEQWGDFWNWESELIDTSYGYTFEIPLFKYIEYMKTEKFYTGGELKKGIKTEMEHKDTLSKIKTGKFSVKKGAEMIAKDHLEENDKYYTHLEKMESKFEEGGKVESIHSEKGDIMVSLDDNWYSDDSSVELVPVTELIKFREFDRKVKPKYNKDNSIENINHLKFMFQKEGVKSPLIIEYSAEDNAVLIIEGNHRLNSAIDLGMEYLPARVVLKKYGKYSPVKIKNAMKVDGIKANSSNYIPSDLKPSYVGITGAKPIAYAEGGIIEGRLHSECGDDGCGRKFQVGENGHIIEAERDEAVIVADAFNETKEMTIEGTPSEIASALNVIGGGKNFDSGAKIVDGGKEKELPEMKKEATDTDVDDVIDSGSIIINRRSMADEKSYKVTGSAKQIASAINSINGNGVVIEQGAKIE